VARRPQVDRPGGFGLDDTAQLLVIAGVLGTLTVLVYRLGVWRQEMENTKQNLTAEIKAHREGAGAYFDRRNAASKQSITSSRWPPNSARAWRVGVSNRQRLDRL
jgi:hypothetical protein